MKQHNTLTPFSLLIRTMIHASLATLVFYCLYIISSPVHDTPLGVEPQRIEQVPLQPLHSFQYQHLNVPNHVSIHPADAVTAQFDPQVKLPTATIQPVSFSTKLIGRKAAFNMLDNMSNKQLLGYLNNMVPSNELHRIHPRTFAKRALSELYPKTNNPMPHKIPSPNKITVGFDRTYPPHSVNLTSVDAYQRIYMHLYTEKKVGHDGRIFIKWVHKNSGQVMLFNMKYINPRSHTNWVSLSPSSGWQVGDYEVVYYAFTSQLEPIATLTFRIENITGNMEEEDEWIDNDMLSNTSKQEIDDTGLTESDIIDMQDGYDPDYDPSETQDEKEENEPSLFI